MQLSGEGTAPARPVDFNHIKNVRGRMETQIQISDDQHQAGRATPPRYNFDCGHQADVYPLAVSALDVLCRGARPELLFWFELRLLTLLGFAPRLTQCARCGAPARDRSLLFSHADGGVLCPACSRAHPRGGPSRPLSPALLALLRRWNAHGGSAHAARNIRCSRSQLSDARDLLGFFLDYHLDLCPESRKLALQMMAS